MQTYIPAQRHTYKHIYAYMQTCDHTYKHITGIRLSRYYYRIIVTLLARQSFAQN